MGWFFLLPHFTFYLFLLLTHFPSYTHTHLLCNHQDSSSLLQFKNSFTLDEYSFWCDKYTYTFKTDSWKNGTDCCEWDGVTCNNLSGHVIGLDLSCGQLEGKLYPNSTIFQLRHLQKLNLAFNNFFGSSIHYGIGDLVNLTHLNLSYSGIGGDIPPVISHLSKLVSISLDNDFYSIITMRLDPFTWQKLILNATNLRELHLDAVNMSSIRERSLSLLMNLSSSLVSLTLSHTGLHGNFPNDILSLPNLQKLDLSGSDDLSVQLPKSNWSTPLRYLDLSSTASSGEIPNSIGHLKSLNHLSLYQCHFVGLIPPSLWNLTQMTYLSLSYNNFQGEKIPSLLSNLIHLTSFDLGNNNFSGPIPDVFGKLIKLEFIELSSTNLYGQVPSSLFNLTQLSFLDLSSNNLVGPIPNEITNHSKLVFLGLGGNMLNGTIPQWCYSLSSLEQLYLEDNRFTGLIGEFSTFSLEGLYLSNNNLQGDFPISIFKLENLTDLRLSSNSLSGLVDFHQFSNLQKLESLDLSKNSFHFINNTNNSADYILPNLRSVFLSSNNISSFPIFLKGLPNIQELDLSNNKIQGEIPKWFHRKLLNSGEIYSIDLSFNKFQGDLPILPNRILFFLASNNNFSGNIASTLCNASSLFLLNLAHNNLSGMIPQCFHRKLLNSGEIDSIDLSFNKFQGDLPILPNGIRYFFASNNNFSGNIASTLCNASSLSLLNLAHNNLSGMIPQCLGSFPSLSVLDLQMNNLTGRMPRNFSKENAFETIKLNGNQLEGPLPQSLANCTNLQVLDLGNNIIEDVFPNWLETLQELQVLSLRSNKLHGAITCSSMKHPFLKLRIFDVSNNNFSGLLPKSCIKNFQGMVTVSDSQTGPQYMMGEANGDYYNDSVVVIIKGISEELTRILTTFTTIDLSNNMFEGEIPELIGELHSLKGLNLSHNGIIGTIPHSLSNLTNLEWLDLSRNKLMGEIPVALTNLTSLSILNLSQNQLEGMIPTGKQFNTFGNDSYEGNPLLCGLPLSKSCKNDEERPPYSTFDDEEDSGDSGFGWKAVVIGYACGAVFGVLMGYNVLLTGRPQWLARLVESAFNTTLRRAKKKRVNGNRRGMN